VSDEADWIAAGLLDPGSPEGSDRRELLAYLDALGISIEEMIDAQRRRGLGVAASDQLLHREPTHTLASAAAAAAVSVELARRIILAAGFPMPGDGETALTDEDAVMLAAFSDASVLLGEEPVLAFLRVVASSLARIAEAADAMFLTEVEGPMRAGGSTSTEVAEMARQSLQRLLGLPDVMAPMFRRHVASAVERSRAARPGGLVDRFVMSVGFADLVGSTRLVTDVKAAELGTALADFEREAADRCTANGARLVKVIGDEVMVAGIDPVAVVDVLTGLVEFVDAHEVLTALRASVAHGELQGRGGDWFGPDVNIAARAVKEADPGQVIVTVPVAEALAAAGRHTTPVGFRPLRGLEEPVELHVVGGPRGDDG
jgi:class 3 adenylate cyclase